MNERILEEIADLVWKQNQIQEGIRREMELQNDLKVNDMLNDERLYNRDFIEMDIDDVTREKLYARLSDEDRSILERYREANPNSNDELKLYDITVKGPSHGKKETEMWEIIERLHLEILNDVYTEKELYEYVERVLERGEMTSIELAMFWESRWKGHKIGLMEDNEKGTCFDFRDFDEEEVEEYKRKFMEKYESRITKGLYKNEEQEDTDFLKRKKRR